ncbi:protein kinase [Candidatus Dependentiae bacterium]|nr:protein kinase [Candidatus Dependentiae bacterium]
MEIKNLILLSFFIFTFSFSKKIYDFDSFKEPAKVHLDVFKIRGKCDFISSGAEKEVYTDDYYAYSLFYKYKKSKIFTFKRSNFKKEVLTLKKLNHKNIIKFLGYDKKNSIVVTELGECNLREFVHYTRKIDLSDKLKIIKGIIDGIDYLHNKKIVHCDLKPSNIVLKKDLTPKIIDFSSVQSEGKNKKKFIFTTTYCCPEKLRFVLKDKDFHSYKMRFSDDIYSLGFIIYFIMSEGEHKYSRNIDKYIRKIFKNWRPKLSYKNPFSYLIKECWKQDPEKRPSIKEVSNMFKLTLKLMEQFNIC